MPRNATSDEKEGGMRLGAETSMKHWHQDHELTNTEAQNLYIAALATGSHRRNIEREARSVVSITAKIDGRLQQPDSDYSCLYDISGRGVVFS